MVDTTVQEKAIAHPTDARLTHRAIEKLVEMAKREGVELRQSYLRVARRGPLWWGAIRMPTSSSALGGNSNSCAPDLAASSATFAERSRPMPHGRIALVRCSILHCGFAIKSSANADQRSTHGTPRGGVHRPRQGTDAVEFGCKVSIATPATAPKGGQFVLHAKALHGNPYDGHTLGPVITDLEKLTGVAVRRIHGDKGYRGHN